MWPVHPEEHEASLSPIVQASFCARIRTVVWTCGGASPSRRQPCSQDATASAEPLDPSPAAASPETDPPLLAVAGSAPLLVSRPPPLLLATAAQEARSSSPATLLPPQPAGRPPFSRRRPSAASSRLRPERPRPTDATTPARGPGQHRATCPRPAGQQPGAEPAI